MKKSGFLIAGSAAAAMQLFVPQAKADSSKQQVQEIIALGTDSIYASMAGKCDLSNEKIRAMGEILTRSGIDINMNNHNLTRTEKYIQNLVIVALRDNDICQSVASARAPAP